MFVGEDDIRQKNEGGWEFSWDEETRGDDSSFDQLTFISPVFELQYFLPCFSKESLV